jgi:choice-of-anchor B domain-containing protein
MNKILSFIFIFLSFTAYTQTPCVDGMANGYPCNLITLQSQVTASQLQGTFVNDIWGWTDPITGKEYALVGLSDGVSFVDVTSPTSPVVIGKLIETHDHSRTEAIQHGESSWRDIKVYADHAYVVSDLNQEHGMQIFDLTQLRDFDGSSFQTFEQTARYPGIGSAHNIVINEETGYGYIVGISSGSGPCTDGGLHIVDLQDPANPQYVACFDDDGYTHDAQCVIYNGSDADYVGMEICFNSNEDTFTIANTNDKNDIQMISRTSYTDAGYTHQGWLSEDQDYFFMNDEFDEGDHGYNPRTIIWDVKDLDNPIHIGDFYNEAVSIDHNLYTHNNMIFESNYSSGLRVVDYTRVANIQLREVAFFDTNPSSDVIEYVGSWSNYPYFESGNIIVSDMSNGLFVLRLDLSDPITSHPEDVTGCNRTIQTFSVETDNDDMSYQWQELKGTSFVDLIDNEFSSGTTTTSLTMDLRFGSVRAKIKDNNGSIFYSFPAEMESTGNSPDVDFEYQFIGNNISCTNLSAVAESYEWDFGDGSTSIEENPTHTYESFGEYSITLTATYDCGVVKEAKIVSYILGGVDNPEIRIYPNPSSSLIFVNVSNTTNFQIHDLSGKLHYSGSIDKHSNSINVSDLTTGVYLLSLEMEGKKILRRISIN